MEKHTLQFQHMSYMYKSDDHNDDDDKENAQIFVKYIYLTLQ